MNLETLFLQLKQIRAPQQRHNALWKIGSTKSGSVSSARKWSLPNAINLSVGVSCVFLVWAPEIRLANGKPIELVGKMNAASVTAASCLAVRGKSTIKSKATSTVTRQQWWHSADTNSGSGNSQIVVITLSRGNTSIETMVVRETGSTLSFVDKEDVRDKLPLISNHGQQCCYHRDKRNVKTNYGRTLTGPLSKHEVAHVVAINHVATDDEGLGVQTKTSFNMISDATRVNTVDIRKKTRRP